jgi:glycosyltransferase involved in cell wall biosynthesis
MAVQSKVTSVRILSIATTHPRFEGDSEPAYVLALNRELVRRGHEVTALVPHASGAETKESIQGVRIRRFRYFIPPSAQMLCYNGGILPNLRKSWTARLNLPFFLAAQAGAVARAVAFGSFDLIHCHWLITSGLMGALVGAPARLPLIVTAHGSDVFTENRLFKALDRWVLEQSCVCTVNSNRSGELVARLNPKTRIEPVPMGVYPERHGKHLASDSVRSTMGDGSPQILFVGRFSKNKGITDLVRAMPTITAALPGAHLALVGFGPDEDRIRSTITAEGMGDRVTIVGRVAGGDIPVHMASADLVVLPSIRIEGLGVVLLEALASGTAVVGSDVGGIPDIIEDGVTGLLCRSQDPPDIAAKCVRILQDEDLKRRTTENGKRLVDTRFCWTRIGAVLESIMLDCLDRSSAPGHRDGGAMGSA